MQQTVDDDMLMDASLADRWRQALPRAGELRDVHTAGGRALPWKHLLAQVTLPRLHEHTQGVVRDELTPACSMCLRDGHYGLPTQPPDLVYARSSFPAECMTDPQLVASTWECFGVSNIRGGYGRINRVAKPLFVVGDEVAEVLRREVRRALRIYPVRFVDE